MSFAVRNRTPTSCPSARNFLQTSKPSRSGSITSRMSACGLNSSATRKASAPLAAVRTSKPTKRRLVVISSLILFSSSTTRTFWTLTSFVVVIDGSFLTRTVEFISNHLEGHLVGLTLELPEKRLGYRGEFCPLP